MKIRMHGDSIRYRLNRREVAEFAQTGRAETTVHFPNASLRYVLEAGESLNAMEAAYTPGLALVRIPGLAARTWADGEDVALHGTINARSGASLEILIEKDFQCLHKGDEGKDPEAYPNPAATSAA